MEYKYDCIIQLFIIKNVNVQCGILADYLFTLNVKGTFPEVISKCHNIGFLVLDTLCDNKLLIFINMDYGNGIYNHGLSSTTYTHYNITW